MLPRRAMAVILSLAMCGSLTGCSLEEGAREGVVDGVSGAVSALIQAPVLALLDRLFPQP